MRKSTLLLFVTLLIVSLIGAACTTASTTTAMCAFISGNGSQGTDAAYHRTVYPGQLVNYDPTRERVTYVPCNSRNYIVNDGNVYGPGDPPVKVGDRFNLMVGYTDSGTKIFISGRALWTLNQSPEAMALFFAQCYKYQCASDKDDTSGGVNFSTPGWNGLLAENLGTAMDQAAWDASALVSDDIWRKHDPKERHKLEDAMSAAIGLAVQANFGFETDLFCGSGNSKWPDPLKPGEGTYYCSPIRIVIASVERDPTADTTAESAAALNEQRLANARVLYGDQAEYWLGMQDTIEACRNAGATCMFNIGGNSVPNVIPQAQPTQPVDPNAPTSTPTTGALVPSMSLGKMFAASGAISSKFGFRMPSFLRQARMP